MRIEMRIKRGVEGLRTADFNNGLDGAIGTMTFPSTRSSKHLWIRPAGVIAGGTVAIAASLLLLIPAKAVGLDEVRQALKSVPASHSRYFNAKGELIQEFWQEGTKRRYRFWDEIDRGYNGKFVWFTHPRDRYGVISSEEPDGFGTDGTGVENEIKRHEWQVIGKPTVSKRTVSVEGSSYSEITIQSRPKSLPNGVMKTVLLCQERDNLPVRVDNYYIHKGKERKTSWCTNEYPKGLSDSVFDPVIPSGFAVLDEKAAIEQIESRLTNPAFQRTVNGITVTLLGVFEERPWANWRQSSSAYILFAGGETPHIDVNAGLLDENGKGYSARLYYEADDRDRPRNHGKVAPSSKPLPPLEKRMYHGKTAGFPQQVRPLFFLKGRPIYCVQFMVEPNLWRSSRKVTASIPLSSKSPERVLRVGTKGVFVKGWSKQVGQVQIEDTTVPIQLFARMLRQLDGKVKGLQSIPISATKIDKIRDAKLAKELYGS